MATSEIKVVHQVIPTSMERFARRTFPKKMNDFIFGEVLATLEPEMGNVPRVLLQRADQAPPTRGYTYGGGEGNITAYAGMMREEYPEILTWDTIDNMLKNGQVRFALELKRSAVLSILYNKLSWLVKCQDKKLGEVVKADLGRVFSHYGYEMLTFLEHGCFFGELIWEQVPASMRGLSGKDKWWVLEGINTCQPKTIDYIQRIANGPRKGEFDGFKQAQSWPWEEHVVPVEQALVLTFRKKFRSLWGEPILIPAYPLWYWYDIILASFIKFLDRMGIPLIVVRAPSRGTMKRSDGKSMNTMEYGLLVAGEATRSTGVVLPSDRDPEKGNPLWEIEYLSAQGQGAQFIEALKFVSDLITRSIVMGAMADISQAGGGFNREEQAWAMTQLDNGMILEMFISQLSRYLMPKYATYNATPDTYLELLTMGLDPDKIERVFTFLSTAGNQPEGEALKWPDWPELFRLSGIPTRSQRDVDKMKAEEEEKAVKEQKMIASQQRAAQRERMAAQQKQAAVEGPGTAEKKLEEILWQVIVGDTPILLDAVQLEGIAQQNPDLFHDGTTITLFNPYHDPKSGQFASKIVGAVGAGIMGAAESLADPKFAAAAAVVASGYAREALRSPEEKRRIQDETTAALNSLPDDLRRDDLKIRHHAGIATYTSEAASLATLGQTNPIVAMSAGYVVHLGSKKVNVSPMAVRALSSEDETQRAFGRHIVTHESIHARKRIGAMPILQQIPLLGAIPCRANMPFEEGMTDILASMSSGVSGAGPYSKYRDRMARIAMAANGNDKKRAVQWIKDAHYRVAGPFDMANDLRKSGYNISALDVFNYAHTGKGNLADMMGKTEGYGNKFTRSTRKYKGYWKSDTNFRRIATGTAEAIAGYYYRNRLYQAVWDGLGAAWEKWEGVPKLEEAVLLQDGDKSDWDLSLMLLAIGPEGISEILSEMPEEDREMAMLYMGLGLDSVPWSLSEGSPSLEDNADADFFLMNPYHDPGSGRFTTKSGGFNYGTPVGDEFKQRFETNSRHIDDELASRLPGCERPVPVSVQPLPGVGLYYGAYFNGKIYVPADIAIMAAEDTPGFGHHSLAHEKIHSRKRTGKNVPIRGPKDKIPEEGSTELLARKLYRDIYGQPSPSRIYNAWVGDVGRAAWYHSNGDPEVAWKYIDDLHNGRIDFEPARDGTGWEAMIGAEYKFEDGDDLETQLLALVDAGQWEEAKMFVEEHKDDEALVFMFGELWIAEFGIDET